MNNIPDFLKNLKDGDEVLCEFIWNKAVEDFQNNCHWITIVTNIYPDIITYSYTANDQMYFGRAKYEDYGKLWKVY